MENDNKTEVELKKKLTFNDVYEEYKEFIYPFLFYIAGLLLIALLFPKINTSLNSFMQDCFLPKEQGITALLINSFSVYFSVFSIAVFLGLCLIGYPLINIIPLVFGFVTGCKICFFYVNYSFNGIAYSLLLIIPEVSAFLIVLFFTIKNSSLLSKNIYSLTTKKSDTSEDLTFKSYLINYLKYAVLVAVIAVVNSLITALMQSIISL